MGLIANLCLSCMLGEHNCIGSPYSGGGRECQCGCVAAELEKDANHYRTLGECLVMATERNRSKLLDLYEDLLEDPVLSQAAGSSHNHQAWPGGYLHHVREAVNVGYRLYYFAFGYRTRPFPFGFDEAVDVLLLHDVEKPWKKDPRYQLLSKEERENFRMAKVREYEIELTPDQVNALTYCEGEYKNYSSHERRMNEMAAFCNMCDVASARIWHDKGMECSW